MKHLIPLTTALILSLPATLRAQTTVQVFKDEYIIQRNSTLRSARKNNENFAVISRSEFTELIKPIRQGTTASAVLSAAPSTTLAPLNSALVDSDCEEIKKDPSISTCEPNFVQHMHAFPNDPNFYLQYGLYNPLANGTTSFDMRAHLGWDKSIGSASVVIGILDSGINYLHLDLQPNLWRNPGEIPANGFDDDNNGYVDDVVGINAHLGTGDPFDCNGHGSHVAGIIGARGNNGIGITGVAWNVQLASSKHGVDCGDSVSTAAAIKGMEYFYKLKKRGINIVALNASYGGDTFTQAESDMIRRLATVNVLFVAAAGNDGVNIEVSKRYPGAYAHENMITVANLDNNTGPNQINPGSNYGESLVDIGAPGTDILSTVHTGAFVPDLLDFKTGTSMAAPMVAGAAAVLSAQRPSYLDYHQLKEVILGSAFKIPPLAGKVRTGGTLDLGAIVNAPAPTDNCPSDPNKSQPGFCGCGNSDAGPDTDNDTIPDCADGCPADAGKSSPGSCGCGVQDADGNGTGTPDCIDAQIASVTPDAPTASKKNKNIIVSATPRAGAGYLFTIVTSTKNKKKTTSKTSQISSNEPTATFKAPKAGSKLEITYQYTVGGPGSFLSALSPIKKMSIKKPKKK